MTSEELAIVYDAFSKEKQTFFLTTLIHMLTIGARGHYSLHPQVVSSSEEGSSIGAYNEIFHRLAGHLRNLLSDMSDRANGEDIVADLMTWSVHGHIEQEVIWAIETAVRNMQIRYS